MGYYLESSQCILRQLTKNDLNDYVSFKTDKANYIFELREAQEIYEVEDLLNFILKSYFDKFPTYHEYGICTKADNKLIGSVSYTYTDPEKKICTFGYVLNKDYTGQGFMTEILKEFVAYQFNNGCVKLMASCSLDNIKSWKLLERLGFEREGLIKHGVYAHGRYHDEAIYGILKN